MTFILFIILLNSACEKTIEIDIDEISPMIVLNGLIEADSSVVISLTRTRHILDNAEISTLTSAFVELSDNQGNSAILTIDGSNKYVTESFSVEPGTEYIITASAEGYYDVEAVCIIPEAVAIIRIDTATVYNEWNEPLISMGIVFQDDPSTDNYYQLFMMSKSYYTEWDIVERLDTLYIDPVTDTVITAIVLDTIITRIPFYSDLYFESEDLIIEEEDNRGGVIFSDQLIQGKEYILKGNIYTYFSRGSQDTTTIYVKLHSISKDYYEYVSSLEKHYYSKNDPFATPVVVHSNIQDGLGIFGGRSTSIDSIKIAPQPYEDDIWEIY